MLAVSLLAFAAACSDRDSVLYEDELPTAAPDTPVVEEPEGPGSIVEVATEAGTFATLLAAVDAAGLAGALSDESASLTVFAPTEEAFAALPEGTLDALLADPDALANILTYHVLGSAVTVSAAAELAGTTVETLNGGEVALTARGADLYVNEAKVVAYDIEASNGVIHVIDTVLLPVDLTPSALTIAEIAVADENFETLVGESNENDSRVTNLETLLYTPDGNNLVVGNGLLNNVVGGAEVYFGTGNTAVGGNAMLLNISGASNTAMGRSSLYYNESGSLNTAIGYISMPLNISGAFNTAVGAYSLYSNTAGINNVAFGYKALFSNTTANSNTALGTKALEANTEGMENVAVGGGALSKNVYGFYNTAVGFEALNNIVGVSNGYTGNQNTAVGHAALRLNTWWGNTAVGSDALSSNTTGGSNVAVGRKSMLENETGFDNTSIGNQSLSSNTAGDGNVAVGAGALSSNETGSLNTAIGYEADVAQEGITKATAIGHGAKVTSSSAVQIGNLEVTDVFLGRKPGELEGFGQTQANANLKLLGKVTSGAVTYPNQDGEAGQVLTTDGNGNLSWSDDAIALMNNSDLIERIAALEAQLRSQQDELLAIIQSQQAEMALQQDQIAELQSIVSYQFVSR